MTAIEQQSDFWSDALARTRFRKYLPMELAEQAALYFKWCNENPLYETDIRSVDGCVVETPIAKVRAFTKRGFMLWLGMTESNYRQYAADPAYADVIHIIENIIHTQKFENAAAGLLNSNFIARDLNLAESVDHKSSDGSMSPKSNIDWDSLPPDMIETLLNARKPTE